MKKPATKPDDSNTNPMTATMNIMGAFAPVQETALKAWFDMGQETLRFVSSRMHEDIETQQAMLTCKTAEEIREVQSDFYTRALEDYRAQTSRMMKIISSTTRRGYDDVPL